MTLIYSQIKREKGMKKLIVVAAMFVMVLSLAGSATAAQKRAASQRSSSGFQQEYLYIGGGLGINSLSGFDDAMGWQIFGGYELPYMIGDAKTAIEVGYMNSGEFEMAIQIPPFPPIKVTTEAKGLWATGVVSYPVNKQFDLIGRVGLDLGDDNGLMLGGGAGFNINNEMQIRAEYVIRENIDSLQANFVYRF